jgi:DNA replication and repair protein RecF
VRLSQISAHGFRNLSQDPIFFPRGVTLIAGENAQGKTNLLEAVAVLCGQRSFRRARPGEMASDGAAFRVEASIEAEAGSEQIAVSWSRESGRTFRRGQKSASFREISALAPAVFLAPDHRDLITGPPGHRRRFLDRLVLSAHPAAGEDLVRFERALKERNALLSRARDGRATPGELDAWTDELVSTGAAVRRHRRRALAEWVEIFQALAAAAGQEYSTISVGYVSEGETEEDLRRALSRLVPHEKKRGYTLSGPHRDDLAWTRGGRPLAAHASAGEIHRTVALAKLAEWRAVERVRGEAPLLGVDEFDAGLSPAWVEAFLREIPEAATVLLTTASEPTRWRRWAGEVLEMRAGAVSRRPRAVND